MKFCEECKFVCYCGDETCEALKHLIRLRVDILEALK